MAIAAALGYWSRADGSKNLSSRHGGKDLLRSQDRIRKESEMKIHNNWLQAKKKERRLNKEVYCSQAILACSAAAYLCSSGDSNLLGTIY